MAKQFHSNIICAFTELQPDTGALISDDRYGAPEDLLCVPNPSIFTLCLRKHNPGLRKKNLHSQGFEVNLT